MGTLCSCSGSHCSPAHGELPRQSKQWPSAKACCRQLEPMCTSSCECCTCALPLLLYCVQAGTLPPTVFAEALACLACLDIPGHDYAQLMCSTGIHTFLAELATAGGGCPAGQDSVLLGVVEAVGVLCADEACAGMLASAGLVSRQARRGFTLVVA